MKKILLTLFATLLISQCGLSYAATETTNFFTTLKNVIIRDVQETVNSTVTATANRAVNTVKIAQYKQQIEQKKQELADLEAAHKNFISKFFQRRRINNEIRDIEAIIKTLEA